MNSNERLSLRTGLQNVSKRFQRRLIAERIDLRNVQIVDEDEQPFSSGTTENTGVLLDQIARQLMNKFRRGGLSAHLDFQRLQS